MRKFKLECGYIAYKVTIEEIGLLGGFGMCDMCNTLAFEGYLVPVMNRYMCPDCFKEWSERAIYHPQDIPIESKNSRCYESIIPMEGEDKMAMYNTCDKCGANLDPGEICDCTQEQEEILLSAKEVLESYNKMQEENGCTICPRCGKNQMHEKATKNAMSRRAHIYICSACGMEEAIKDMIGDSPIPFEDWAIVKQKESVTPFACTLPQP